MKALLLFVAMCGIVRAEGLTKVWEMDLNESKSPPLRIVTMGFRPDGRELLVIAQKPSVAAQFILLISTADPSQRRPLEIDAEAGSAGMGTEVTWSPDGKFAAVGHVIVQVDDGSSCRWTGGLFARTDYVVERFPTKDVGYKSVDSHCQPEKPMTSSPNMLTSASSEAGLIESSGWDHEPRLIRDSTTGKTVGEFPRARWIVLADHGQAGCSNLGPDWQQRIECRGVQTGETLWSKSGFGWIDVYPALNAKRLVVSKHGRIIDFIDWRWAVGKLNRREVWDFGSGKLVASWSPRHVSIRLDEQRSREEPGPFAISADGEYIAEGGDGEITLYKIAPAGH